jgi:hypothetical protein
MVLEVGKKNKCFGLVLVWKWKLETSGLINHFAYENVLVMCLENVSRTSRTKLGLVEKRWCVLLFSAVMTGATRQASCYSPWQACPEATRHELARASSTASEGCDPWLVSPPARHQRAMASSGL